MSRSRQTLEEAFLEILERARGDAMRPYLAVIRDSFHEALVSRVLWILLAIITLVLLALVPLGFIEQAGSVLRDDDFLNREQADRRKVVAQGKSPRAVARPADLGAARRPDAANRSTQYAKDPASRPAAIPAVCRSAANDDRAAAIFTPRRIGPKSSCRRRPARWPPRDWTDLPDDQVARFNRLALDAAFPARDRADSAQAGSTGLLQLGAGSAAAGRARAAVSGHQPVAGHGAWRMLLGVAGVFVAVLVTASMIPQTFEAGSVDLLLSKPIYRGWLFLAKFVGGCAFIAINAAYFIGGLWLVLGLRFGLWNERLLLAIPLYLFLFAIYYGVSALAGIVWRNAIVSVVMAVLFWFVCWTLGTATQLVENLSLNPRRLVTIVPAGDELIAVNSQGDVFRWDDARSRLAERSSWPAAKTRCRSCLPAGWSDRSTIRRASGSWHSSIGMPGFSPLQASNRLLVGKRADDWRRSEGVNVPDGAAALFLGPHGDVADRLVAGHLSAGRRPDSQAAGHQRLWPAHSAAGKGRSVCQRWIAGAMRPLESAAIDPQLARIALFDGYRLVLFERERQGRVSRNRSESTVRPEADRQKSRLPAARCFWRSTAKCGATIAKLELADTAASAVTRSLAGVGHRLARRALPGGRLSQRPAVAVRPARAAGDRVARSPGRGTFRRWPSTAQTCRGRSADARHPLRPGRARGAASAWQGQLPLAEKIYRYALHPLYTVFPKPSQLNETVTYVLTSNESKSGGIRLDNGNGGPQKLDVWGPVWSNLAFLVVVLAIACVVIYRKDF